MPSKLQMYEQMADQTAKQVTGSFGEWTAFLETMGRLYRSSARCSSHGCCPGATAQQRRKTQGSIRNGRKTQGQADGNAVPQTLDVLR